MNWRTHPALQGRFLPEHPDDLQVIVHDGGPRITDKRPEAVWVTVTGSDADGFVGRILNEPEQLRTVRREQEIRFVAPAGCELPVMVTGKYLHERSAWTIQACNKCGFAELFDAPSDLMRVAFPSLPEGAVVEAFTTFCPMCGGVQLLQFKGASDPQTSNSRSGKSPWWQFWK